VEKWVLPFYHQGGKRVFPFYHQPLRLLMERGHVGLNRRGAKGIFENADVKKSADKPVFIY
jgi:hypothetical protein